LLESNIHLVHPDGNGKTTLPFPQKISELLSLDWAVGVPQQARAGDDER